MSVLPFQDQVEPVAEDGHPDEPERRVPAQVEPDREEEIERGVQVGHRGRQAEQALVPAVRGLQMDRQLDPPAVQEIHDVTNLCLRGIRQIWLLFWSFRPLPGSPRPGSPLLSSLCVIPVGLYSRLAYLFAFGTLQTGSLTFTPFEVPPEPKIHHHRNQLPPPFDGSQILLLVLLLFKCSILKLVKSDDLGPQLISNSCPTEGVWSRVCLPTRGDGWERGWHRDPQNQIKYELIQWGEGGEGGGALQTICSFCFISGSSASVPIQ